MPVKEQWVAVKGMVQVPAEAGDHPMPPIYIPVDPPDGIWGGGNENFPTPPIYIPLPPLGIWGPDDPRPTPPIYIPVDPPGDWDLVIWGPDDPRPNPPIYIPIAPPDGAHPEHPIELPDVPPFHDWTDEMKEKLKSFLLGNLPPYEGGPDYVAPVKRQ